MNALRPKLRLIQGTAEGCAGSDPIDFDALFARYGAYVAGIAARMLGRDDEALDDVVQEVFFIALTRLDRIYSTEAARPWLVTVTVRVVQRVLRRRRWRRLFFGQGSIGEIPAAAMSAEQRSLLVRIYRTLDDVDPNCRIAWLLRHVEGERLEDVATACGCSLATAKRRIASVQDLLEEVLRDG